MIDFDITVKFTKDDKTRLQPYLSNWVKAHAYIRQMKPTEESLLELRKMISIELTTQARVQMITRLRSRYIALRKVLEDQMLFRKLEKAQAH